MAENGVDLYTSNLANMPVLVRVGADDNTIPPIHSRRLVRLINEWSGQTQSTKYLEDQGKGHWYQDMLKDDVIQNFLGPIIDPEKNSDLDLPLLPNPFTISTMNPGSTGSRGGIRILQLEVPFRCTID